MLHFARFFSPPIALYSVVGVLGLAFSGCSSSSSPAQRVETELTKIGKSTTPVSPLAGKVEVDGQAPQGVLASQRIVVVLFDQAKPTLGVAERPFAVCNERGEFAFTTYSNSDGVPPADYVVTFAQLCVRAKDGSLIGPDGLKNLYNDPDKNEKSEQFLIKHAAPGKKDYAFELKEAGQEPATAPGPRAVTEMINR